MNRTVIYILLCILAIASLSCERRPLVDTSEKVRVRVILKNKEVPNVTTGIYNNSIEVPDITPGVIRVMFYDADTKNVTAQGFISKKGVDENGYDYIEGDVIVYPGTYNVVCYNFDTPSTLVADENNYNTITAYTSEISDILYSRFNTRAEEANPRIYYTPDHLLVAREKNVVIAEHTDIVEIVTEAHTVVDTYYVQIRLVNGRYASDATAVLTDLAPSNRFAVGERNYDEYAGIFFEMQRSTDTRIRATNQDVLCAVFNTFGKRPDEIDPSLESKLYVTFNVIRVDGQVIEMTLNMDSIFKTEPAVQNNWLLIDKEFVIPEPDTPDPPPGGEDDKGMFDPTVEAWNKDEGFIDI